MTGRLPATMTDDIVHEATYPYPPADVWRAIVTPEALSSWLMQNDLKEAKVGERFEFRDKPRPMWNGITKCEVVELVPERRFVLAFGLESEFLTRVSFELEPTAEGGTRLKFRHSGFQGLKGWMMRAGMKNGWGGMVQRAIPFVVESMRRGRIPARDETKAARLAKAA